MEVSAGHRETVWRAQLWACLGSDLPVGLIFLAMTRSAAVLAMMLGMSFVAVAFGYLIGNRLSPKHRRHGARVTAVLALPVVVFPITIWKFSLSFYPDLDVWTIVSMLLGAAGIGLVSGLTAQVIERKMRLTMA